MKINYACLEYCIHNLSHLTLTLFPLISCRSNLHFSSSSRNFDLFILHFLLNFLYIQNYLHSGIDHNDFSGSDMVHLQIAARTTCNIRNEETVIVKEINMVW